MHEEVSPEFDKGDSVSPFHLRLLGPLVTWEQTFSDTYGPSLRKGISDDRVFLVQVVFDLITP